MNDEELQSEFEKNSTLEPVREDVEMPKLPATTEKGNVQSLTDKIDQLSDLTDMQAYLYKLFPENLGSPSANAIMISRISPDVFLPLLRLMVENEIMNADPTEPINVIDVVQRNYTLLSVGLDGKGRIDIAELAGAARETKMMQETKL